MIFISLAQSLPREPQVTSFTHSIPDWSRLVQIDKDQWKIVMRDILLVGTSAVLNTYANISTISSSFTWIFNILTISLDFTIISSHHTSYWTAKEAMVSE